jgi:hypothetical protein
MPTLAEFDQTLEQIIREFAQRRNRAGTKRRPLFF